MWHCFCVYSECVGDWCERAAGIGRIYNIADHHSPVRLSAVCQHAIDIWNSLPSNAVDFTSLANFELDVGLLVVTI